MKTAAVREIKGSFGRFAAILSIIALGAGFFSGVRITTPAMIDTIGGFMNDHEFYDYRLVSSVGWDDEDVKAVAAEDDVRYAEGSNSVDVRFILEEDNEKPVKDDGDKFVLKIHSLPEKVNGVELTGGRLPKRKGECVIDTQSGYEIGDRLIVTDGNEKDTLDRLDFDELRVVGTADSSLYVHWERGSTPLGDGNVSGFAYVSPEEFNDDVYTDIYLRFDQDHQIYSDEYKDFMEDHKALWEVLAEEQAEIRCERIREDAEKKISDGREELDKARKEGEEKLEDAEEQLDDAKAELDDAKAELDDAEKEIKKNEKKLKDAKKELDDGEKQLADGKKQLDDAKKQLSESGTQLDAAKTQLDNAQVQLDIGRQQIDAGTLALNASKQQLDSAGKQISDGEEQLTAGEDKLAAAEKQIADGEAQIADGEKQLADAEKEIADGEKQLAAGEKQLAESEKQVSDGEKQLAVAQQEYTDKVYSVLDDVLWALDDEQKAALYARSFASPEETVEAMFGYLTSSQQAQLTEAKQKIAEGKLTLEQSRAKLEAGKKEVAENKKLIAEKKKELEAGKKEVEANKKLLEEKRAEFEAGKAQYSEGLAQYNSGLETYRSSVTQYTDGLSQYGDGLVQYNNGKFRYEQGLKQYNEGKEQYEENKKLLEDGKKQYEEGKKALEDGKKQFEDGKKQYEEGLEEYEKGLKEYEDGKKELDEKVADAEKELSDAEEKLADLDEPEGFLLDRNANIGYACFENDSEIVEQVSKVFPVFFVLVAALVCMTTMSRMVEEQRTQIGMLKALGYSNAAIMGKFMFYSGSAAVIGCILGYAAGVIVFPKIIWMTYSLMYIPLPVSIIFDPSLALMSLGAALVCSVGMTWVSCRHELDETAAELMRPKAPKAGKRVLLERIPFIWKHMKFLHKVSVRNIFRYKGRLFMMIVGISGCTALLLTGFGIRDSVGRFGDVQYDEILVADAEMNFSAEKTTGTLPERLSKALDEQVGDYKLLYTASWDMLYGDDEEKVKSMTVMAPEDYDGMDKFFRFHTDDGTPVEPPRADEAIVSSSLHDRYGVNIGDEITLRDDKLRELHVYVTGIFDNHIYNYIFMKKATIDDQLGEKTDLGFAYMNFPEGADQIEAAANLSQDKSVVMVSVNSEVRKRMSDTMGSLDYVVILIIVCAAGLAFIVIYNLTNINITERLREIATIKVLGFFRRETSAYVLRENVALTAMGIAVGLGLGMLLHRFVMSQIAVDQVSFKARILPMSCVYSIVLTFAFNFMVNIFMELKLDRINMAESLKSVD